MSNKAQIANTWSEYSSIQNETEELLKTINGPSAKELKAAAKAKRKVDVDDGGLKKKKGKNKKLLSQTVANPKVSNALDKTKHLFNNAAEFRKTVEIMDDASPDVTPRAGYNTKKKKVAEITKADNNGKLSFDDEKRRVASRHETFVSAPGVTAQDVQTERDRLQQMEATTRKQQSIRYKTMEKRKIFLGRDKCAAKLQAVFRGHIGRRSALLARKLKELLADEAAQNPWIEVRDQESGDVWYYHKTSGVSQWERPAEMKETVTAAGNNMKKLPRLKTSFSVPGEDRNGRSIQTAPSKQNVSFVGSTRKDCLTSSNSDFMHKSLDTDGMNTPTPKLRLPLVSQSLSTMQTTDGHRSTAKSRQANEYSPIKQSRQQRQAHKEAEQEKKDMKDIDEILGLSVLSGENLIAPDGKFKPQLRTSILDALLETRFDSVSSVLGDDTQWMDKDIDPFDKTLQPSYTKTSASNANTAQMALTNNTLNLDATRDLSEGTNKVGPATPRATTAAMVDITKGVDVTRKSMVSKLGSVKKKSKLVSSASMTVVSNTTGSPTKGKDVSSGDLTLCEVSFPGMETGNSAATAGAMMNTGDEAFDPNTMCFGCWSAGVKKKCNLHNKDQKMKSSQTMLLCRNWELAAMRRKYRSEEIQEIFLKRTSSLRYDGKRKKFTQTVEKKHPVYRALATMLEHFNSRLMIFLKAKRWLCSLADVVSQGKARGRRSKSSHSGDIIRLKRTATQHKLVMDYSGTIVDQMPIPPVTGYSWPERTKEIQFLYQHQDPTLATEVDLILAYPVPVPIKLYEPREYHLTVSQSIPMPGPEYKKLASSSNEKNFINNEYIDQTHPMGWMERMTKSLCAFSAKNAMVQISAITPMKGLELLRRTKHPPPASVKFATLGRKPCPGNIAVGGLSVELLVSQLVSTYIPAQYGNLMVMDKVTVSPGVSIEATILFQSILMPPVTQPYILRELEHPLNYRHAPTIGINSNILTDEKHYFGLNRPEQTGEQESYGFRTTVKSEHIVTLEDTEARVFTPGAEVVSLNGTSSNVAVTTHADSTYPFCDPSTKDNSTLDFYHLLLTGYISGNKAQVFTALTIQEPGQFMKAMNTNLPLGTLSVNVYRSWAFTQKDTIQEFKSDDGVSYWYHHRTGQTFWERPLQEEEKESPLHGGTVLDQEHAEEPLMEHRGQEGAERRYNQGEFRKLLLNHKETLSEASIRRQSAAASAVVARERGLLPDRLDGASKAAIAANSTETVPVDTDPWALPASEQQGSAGMHAEDFTVVSTTGAIPPMTGQSSRPGTRGPQHHMVRGSQLDEDVMDNNLMSSPSKQPSSVHASGSDMSGNANSALDYQALNPGAAASNPTNALVPGMPAAAPVDPQMLKMLSDSMSNMMSTMMDAATPQDMIQMGLGMGMALMQTGAVKDIVQDTNVAPPAPKGYIQPPSSSGASHIRSSSRHSGDSAGDGSVSSPSRRPLTNSVTFEQDDGVPKQPIGVAERTEIFSSKKALCHDEEGGTEKEKLRLQNVPLTAMENAFEIKVVVAATETPDVAPPKALTDVLGLNAEETVKANMPLLVYPELSSCVEGGVPNDCDLHPAAGLGTSFVVKEDGDKQTMVPDTNFLRRAAMPLPVGFFEAIVAKHVAKQEVDYLPQVPNLPLARTIGRVKPRSAAVDWLAVSFDPWSAGKNPLSSEYVNSLASKAERLFLAEKNATKALEAMEDLRETATKGAFMDVKDEVGAAAQRKEISKTQLLAADFKKLCSLVRHSKYEDAQQLVDQPDWNVPIDFQDELGNALIHVASQNGSKRLVKLCMRRGCNMDIQNLNGQTALHFLFGYGFADLGYYLIKKGADDCIRNKDLLTCYEGLGAKELALL